MNKHIQIVKKTTEELFEGAEPNRFATTEMNFPEANMLNYLKDADPELSAALWGVEASKVLLIVDTSQESMIGDEIPTIWIVVPGMDRIYGFIRRRKEGVQASLFTLERRFMGYQECCIAHQKKVLRHYGKKSFGSLMEDTELNENHQLCDKHRKNLEESKREILHNRIAGMIDITGRKVRWSEICMQFTCTLMNNGFADIEKTRKEARTQMKAVPLRTWQNPYSK